MGNWETIFRDLLSESDKFVDPLGNRRFVVSHRQKTTEELQHRQLLPQFRIQGFDPLSALRIFANQISVLCSESTDVLGIPKKGMALLNELSDDLQIGKSNIYSAAKDLPAGRDSLVIVDDSIHRGESILPQLKIAFEKGYRKISVACIIASQSGIENIKKELNEMDNRKGTSVSFYQLVDVPEIYFPVIFVRILVPILTELRGGVISNRPSITTLVGKTSGTPQEWGKDILETIADMEIVDKVIYIPSAYESQTFHGSVTVSQSVIDDLERRAASSARIDQVKLRLYIAPGSLMRVQLYAIIWLLGRPNISNEDYSSLEQELASHLLDLVLVAFRRNLHSRGYGVDIIG